MRATLLLLAIILVMYGLACLFERDKPGETIRSRHSGLPPRPGRWQRANLRRYMRRR